MDMYRELLLDHYKNPRNYGKIKNPDIKYKDQNPLCGDVVEYYLKIKEGGVEDAKFEGKGCVICMATASILSEELRGKKIDEITLMKKEDVLGLINLELTPTRLKCAMLPLTAVKKGIVEYEKVE